MVWYGMYDTPRLGGCLVSHCTSIHHRVLRGRYPLQKPSKRIRGGGSTIGLGSLARILRLGILRRILGRILRRIPSGRGWTCIGIHMDWDLSTFDALFQKAHIRLTQISLCILKTLSYTGTSYSISTESFLYDMPNAGIFVDLWQRTESQWTSEIFEDWYELFVCRWTNRIASSISRSSIHTRIVQ